MTNLTANILKYAGVVALVLSLIVGARSFDVFSTPVAFGAVGGQLIEDVMPYVRANGGINSGLPISVAGATLTSTATFLGNIIQAGATSLVAIFPGTVLENNVVQSYSGYSTTTTASQTIPVASFCTTATVLVPPSVVSPITITLPQASTTYAGCGAAVGGWSTQIIDNESSVAVTLATTTGAFGIQGIKFMYASGTPATAGAAAWPPTINASTTMILSGQYSSTTTLNAYITMYNRPLGTIN